MSIASHALTLALVASMVLLAQPPPTPSTELAAKAEAIVQAAGIQGSVLLAKGGNVILSKGYGLANIELNVVNTPETKFRIGSITKQFTAAAILQLQEQGKLSVNDPIAKHIPGTPADWSRVTIHHLLTHTSGIPSYTDDPAYPERMREPVRSPIDFMSRFSGRRLDFVPGANFRYDNSGYFLLGIVIEQASGMKYEEYLRKNIFGPLQMDDSGYDWPAAILKNRASGYSKNDGGQTINAEFIDMGQPYSAGSLYSTVLDLYKWDRALYTTTILSKKSIDAAFTPIKFDWSANIKYGYGWGIENIHGHKTVGHGGGINGFSTVIIRAIEEDAAIIILSNDDTADQVGKTGKELLELILSSR